MATLESLYAEDAHLLNVFLETKFQHPTTLIRKEPLGGGSSTQLTTLRVPAQPSTRNSSWALYRNIPYVSDMLSLAA